MPRSKEDIQAQLAAYVDGELDAATRAEIERHLAGNPQHQALMADLMSLRAVIREIPKAPSPADMTEALQSQLERGALLDSAGDHSSDPVLRISRWPQMIMAAAILILAVGLAIMVYAILPHGTRTVAFLPTTAGSNLETSEGTNLDKQKSVDEASVHSVNRLPIVPAPTTLPMVALVPAETPPSATTSPTPGEGAGTDNNSFAFAAKARAGGPAVTAEDLKTVQDRLLQNASATAGKPADLCMVVETPDAANANAVVLRYATENNLAYRAGEPLSRAHQDMAEQLKDGAGDLDAGKEQEKQSLQKALADIAPANEPDRDQTDQKSDAKRQSADQPATQPSAASEAMARAMATNQRSAAHAATEQAAQVDNLQVGQVQAAAPGAPAPGGSAPRPTGAGGQVDQAAKDFEAQMDNAPQAQNTLARHEITADAKGAVASTQPYLVMQMTRQQARELSELLSSQPGQSARLQTLPAMASNAAADASAMPPTTAPSIGGGNGAIAATQPAEEQMVDQEKLAATQPATNPAEPVMPLATTQPVILTTTQPTANLREDSVHVFVVFKVQAPAAPTAAPTDLREPAIGSTTAPATQPAP